MIIQYANSPRLMALSSSLQAYLSPDADIDAFYNVVFNVDTAEGFGLDIWGRIVGLKNGRYVQIPANTFFGFHTSDGAWQPFNQAPFKTQGDGQTQTYKLADNAFRVLILAKAMTNIVATTSQAINQVLQNLFPGRGNCYVNDIGGMQMRYTFEFPLQPWEISVLMSGSALPRPAGVDATILNYQRGSTFGFAEAASTLVTPDATPAAQLFSNDWQGNQQLYPTARTNLLLNSQNLAAAQWLLFSGFSTLTPNAIVAPDGTNSGALLSGNSSGNPLLMYQVLPGGISGTTYCASWFVKQGTASAFTLDNYIDGQTENNTIFSWATSTSLALVANTPGTQYGWQYIGNGWIHVWQVFVAPATNTMECRLWPANRITNVPGTLYVWGPQFEVGSIPTSYIPTASAQVTVTDYVQSGNNVTLAQTPGGPITWSGAIGGAPVNNARMLGTGLGPYQFMSPPSPNGGVAPFNQGTFLSQGSINHVS